MVALIVAGVLALLPVARVVAASVQLATVAQLPGGPQIIQFLDRTLDWYRSRAAAQQLATEPADLAALSDSRSAADEIVRTAFDFARAAAALAGTPTDGSQQALTGRYQALFDLRQRLDAQTQDVRGRIDSLHAQLAHVPAATRRSLQSQLAALQAEASLLQARRGAVEQLIDFLMSTVSGVGGGGLKGQIGTMASAVAPENQTAVHPSATAAAPATATSTAGAVSAPGSGIWDLAARVWALGGKIGRIDQYDRQTLALMQAEQSMRDRFLNAMRVDSNAADQLVTQASAAGAAPPAEQQAQLDTLTTQFKSITAALVPLAKLNVLLSQYRSTLQDWRDNVQREYAQSWRELGVRMGVLVFVLVIVIAAAELWRRAVHHYVRDTRRRYQLLLLRRFVLWFMIAVVLASMLASRLDSFVTFAGLITAGIAVAMQSVILSVVGYFFLIGKYGVRVGDRIQVGEVLGEVIDVGLVRMHLMEYARDDLAPTGRVVAFSNSIVFQAAGGLFKQIPGVYFGWHEMTVTLPADSDPHLVRTRLLAAVESALEAHKEEIERQNREIERAKIVPSGTALRPSVRLRFTATGLEATVRYPIDQRFAGDIDESLSRELLQALSREPRLQSGAAPDLKLNPAPSA